MFTRAGHRIVCLHWGERCSPETTARCRGDRWRAAWRSRLWHQDRRMLMSATRALDTGSQVSMKEISMLNLFFCFLSLCLSLSLSLCGLLPLMGKLFEEFRTFRDPMLSDSFTPRHCGLVSWWHQCRMKMPRPWEWPRPGGRTQIGES